jgi:hypothetical protein
LLLVIVGLRAAVFADNFLLSNPTERAELKATGAQQNGTSGSNAPLATSFHCISHVCLSKQQPYAGLNPQVEKFTGRQ